MKKLLSMLMVTSTMFITLASCASDKLFVGEIKPSKLLTTFGEFNEEFTDFEIDAKEITALKSINEPLEIHVLFGTWCHDSVREVPRLLKLLEHAQNSNLSTKLIAVDYKKTASEKYDLKYTPTFVVFSENKEIGRIVERPKQTLVKDIIAIVESQVTH